MKTKTWQKQLQQYAKEAWDYFENINVVPCPDDIVEYVCERVEDESGVEVDDDGFFGIAKILKIKL